MVPIASHHRPLLLALLTVVLGLASCGERPTARPGQRPLWPELYEIAATDTPGPGRFIRYKAAGPNGGGLDVAVTEYTHPDEDKPRVSLVGVVHIADANYYERIQEVLDRHDLVLFEAIMPEAANIEDWRATMSPEDPDDFAGFQQEVASWMGLEHQLVAIDYSHARNVHADMTVESFSEAGGADFLEEGPLQVGQVDDDALPGGVKGALEGFRSFGRLVGGKPGPLRSLARRGLASAIGEQLDDGDPLGMFPGLSELILDKRNAVAIDVLREHLSDGHASIAVFYGAAHNVDLEKRLTKMGYRRDRAFWLRAWALRPPLR